MNTMLTKKQKISSSDSPSSPRTSFTTLPYDIILNCLARTSRTHAPILSQVSNSLRSIFASPDLEAARFHIGKKPEKCLYVCLNLKNNPTWFVLSTTHKKKLIPLPSFPYQHPNSSTVISNGSDIYLIGGYSESKRKKNSRTVFVLDCKSHQWRQLPDMHASRREPSALIIDGKVCVIGGCSKRYDKKENYGEIYDPNTQTWKPILKQNLICNASLKAISTPRGLTFGDNLYLNIFPCRCMISDHCLIQIKQNDWILIGAYHGKLYSEGSNPTAPWPRVCGLEALSFKNIISIANPGGGSSVIVWWKECLTTTEIWFAEISLRRGPYRIIHGHIVSCENVFTFNESEFNSDFFLHSALVTH